MVHQHKMEGFAGQRAIVLPRVIVTERCQKSKIINGLYITDIGYYPKAQHHFRERPQGIDQYILVYCVEGAGICGVNGKTYPIGAGDFWVIPAKTAHYYMADATNPWTIYWIHFKGAIAKELVNELITQLGGYKGFVAFQDTRIALFEQLYASLAKGYGSNTLQFANMCLWHFIASFMYATNFAEQDADNKPVDAIDASILFMQNNTHRLLTLPVLAQQINLSASHYSFTFKRKTGFAPIEYFNHLKIQKACQFLLFTNLRIKEIARNLGIEDPYYFSRIFSKLMGISPNSYRQKRRS